MHFKERDTFYGGWVGGYTVEDGDDTANMIHDNYTNFVKFGAMSIDQHKRAFLDKDHEEKTGL